MKDKCSTKLLKTRSLIPHNSQSAPIGRVHEGSLGSTTTQGLNLPILCKCYGALDSRNNGIMKIDSEALPRADV